MKSLNIKLEPNLVNSMGAAIAHWIRLRPGFESQAHNQCLYHFGKFFALFVSVL